MLEITRYICESCGTEYKYEEDCKRCENSHSKPIKFDTCTFGKMHCYHKNYPVSISIKMDDGTYQRYIRQEE